jgi:hypothetical protein
MQQELTDWPDALVDELPADLPPVRGVGHTH